MEVPQSARRRYAAGRRVRVPKTIRTVRDMYPEDFAWKPPPYEYEHKKLPIEILCGRPLENIFDETL